MALLAPLSGTTRVAHAYMAGLSEPRPFRRRNRGPTPASHRERRPGGPRVSRPPGAADRDAPELSAGPSGDNRNVSERLSVPGKNHGNVPGKPGDGIPAQFAHELNQRRGMPAHLKNPSKTPSGLSRRGHYRLAGLIPGARARGPFDNHLFLERPPRRHGPTLRRTLTEATVMGFVEHRPTAGIMGRAAPVFPPRLTIKLLARRSPRPGPAGPLSGYQRHGRTGFVCLTGRSADYAVRLRAASFRPVWVAPARPHAGHAPWRVSPTMMRRPESQPDRLGAQH
jgi:hypothetical protein